MFEIDKKKFGQFIAKLRKEKGFTQKEIAKQLLISDKAVSKWETGASLPDTALLIPLSDLLGISVTELLMCERMTQGDTLEANKVENIVKAAIRYGNEKTERAYQSKDQYKWIAFYGLSLFIGFIGIYLNDRTEQPCLETVKTMAFLGAVFGGYFCCFVKTKLPALYDENNISIFYDGASHMNLPGIRFNNSNWPYIVEAIRITMCLSMVVLPIINFILGSTAANLWTEVGSGLFLILFLGGLFIPVYWAGKKYG